MTDQIVQVIERRTVVQVVVGQALVQQGGGGGVTDGDKGGIVVSGSGAVWTVKAASITDLMLGASAIALFAPAAHTHAIANVTGLQAALDGKQASLGFTPEDAAQKGVAGGYAGLDGTGKVPAAQLPAYVDDVVEAANFAALPGTGETGKIYVTRDNNKTWRWSGSAYVEISPSPGSTDSVTEGATNLYFTAARVRTTDLTGYAAAGSRQALAAGDSIIGAMNKIGKWLADLGQAAFAAASAAGLAMLTATDVAAQTNLLNTFTTTLKGLVPAPGSVTGKFLKDDGTWGTPAGGGSPGGSSGELQYNNAGAFAGAADVEIEGGQLRLPAISTPTAPASGGVKLYGTDSFGPTRLGFLGPDGKVRLLQNDLGEFSVQRFQPAPSLATLVGENSLNLVLTGTGTAANPAITNLHTMKPRLDVLVTTPSTSALAAIRPNAGNNRPVRVGRDANAPGGFLARFVWAPATGASNTSHRAFCGLDGTTNTPNDVENSTLTTGIVGMGWDAADANIQIMHNDLSGTATKIDLGSNFPVPTVDRSEVYELQLYSPNSLTQSVSYRVIRYSQDDNTIAAEATGTITTDLPPVGKLLGPHIRMSVGGVSSVVGIACMGILIGREY